MMQEVRFLLNFKEDSISPLALILIGQPSLRNQLKARHLDAIDQRIQTRYQFQGFSEDEGLHPAPSQGFWIDTGDILGGSVGRDSPIWSWCA